MGLQISAEPWSILHGLCLGLVETDMLTSQVVTLKSAICISRRVLIKN